MSISSVSSTQLPAVSGLAASRYAHHKKAFGESKPVASPAATGASTDNAGQLASAIATALAQLGLTAAPGSTASTAIATSVTRAPSAVATQSRTALATEPGQQKAQQQVQQYRNVASTFSSLAQALDASSRYTSSTPNGNGSLTTVFQNLWSSLGATSATQTDAASNALPSLQSFMQTLTQNVGESGIAGLRGMFVDTVA
ncbi:hypothetical protein [Dyella acidiphila]|uniref:Uncharacterized protein n=1 Tax=Dyella acidiphila TaxID=2775866 RepID=A0ABR9G799_9GAMM|nr:hypothetical protein [Dyella acidiphila]MBE1159894.1 hypothetical protein [Dyella acidiphila]